MTLKDLDYSKKNQVENVVLFLQKLFPEININEWEWEYRYSPKKSHTSIFESDNKILAHSALISFDFICNQKIFQSSKFEGSLIDLKKVLQIKEKKNRKVFQNVMNHMISVSVKNNTKFIFGFPSNQAIPSQLKSGFKLLKIELFNLTNPINYEISNELNKFKFYFYKLNSFLLSRYCKSISKNYKNILEYKGGLDKELKLFSNNFSKKNKNLITIFHTEQYILWKYINNPINFYKAFILMKDQKIKGFLGFKIEDQKITITDLSTLNIFISIKFIRFLLKYIDYNKINSINIWIPKLNNIFLIKIIFFFLGFVVQRKFSKKIIYYSKEKSLLNNIQNFNMNKSLLR